MTTTLVAGDIAITAAQADNSGGGANGDFFEFVLLRAVTAGTTIFFTDNGFRTDTSTFRTNENMIRWVAQADLPAGTLVSFVALGGTGPASTAEFTGINPATGAELTTAAFGLATGGDSVTALQSPAFGGAEALTGTAIAQLLFNNATFAATHDNTTGNSQTAIAPGLTDGVNAVSVGGGENARYNEAVAGSIESGTAAQVRASINNDANWQAATTPLTPPGANVTFTITPAGFTGGNDTVVADANGTADAIDGLGGFDELDLSAFTSAITLNTVNGTIASTQGGNDTVANVEFFRTGSADDNVTLGDTGFVVRTNNGNDTIVGGTGRDLVDAGDGNDTLTGGTGATNELAGGAGDDTYFLSNRGDSVIELAGGGTDTVNQSADVYFMTANVEILNYTGTGTFLAVGNDIDNTINGGTGADFINGGAGNDVISGGTGAANTLVGGAGDDTFNVSAAGDSVFELAGEGIDRVVTGNAVFRLGANVENLTFTGSANSVGFGNADANVIIGNSGNNILNGLGGADTITTGAGSDIVLIDANSVDTITDFVSGTDKVLAERATYAGATATIAFETGATATTTNTTLLYNQATGALLIDIDGSGGGAAVAFANFAAGTVLVGSDVVFY